MAGKWDTSLKRLIGANPQHFIQWLLPGAQFQEVVTPNQSMRDLEVDNLYKIVLLGTVCLLHIEFQSYYDATMAKRMWKYNALATIMHDVPVYSVVIYLKKVSVPKPFFLWIFPARKQIHRFDFEVIRLWEIPRQLLKQMGLVGLLPLLILAKGGKRPDVVEEVITSIQASGAQEARELLSLTYILASLQLVEKLFGRAF